MLIVILVKSLSEECGRMTSIIERLDVSSSPSLVK